MKALNRATHRRRAKPAGRQDWLPALTIGAELLLALLGAAGVGTGAFETWPSANWPLLLLGSAVVGAGLWEIGRRRAGQPISGSVERLIGPLLWTVSVWLLYRLLLPVAPQMVLLPAAFLAWLVVSQPSNGTWLSLVVVAGMELALTLAVARQTRVQLGYNLLSYGAAIAGLGLFAHSQVYRHQLRQAFTRARQEAQTREYAQDLGLVAHQPLEAIEEPAEEGPSAVELIDSSFRQQLEILRQALGLTTAALLLPDTESKELRLWSSASARDDLLPGPFPVGLGIAGALFRTGDEIRMAPVKPGYGGLPYYRDSSAVGSLYALRLPGKSVIRQGAAPAVSGILCVDRAEREPWTEEQARLLRLAARKLSLDVDMGRRLKAMGRERDRNNRLYRGLKELNGALGLETACAASIKAIRALVQPDFAAISLLTGEGDRHRVVHAEGQGADKWSEQEFPHTEGWVGQVMKHNQPLPMGGSPPEAVPVFSRSHCLTDFGSLLVMPLCKEEGKPIGALIVAAKAKGVFTKNRREILDLIATQVAVKIDQAQAHERINSLATTDGLTGLANHRTFQDTFDLMLYRAERRELPLSIILCDLDHFKKLNDKYGHPFGDQVLKSVAEVLAGAVRRVDLAARYGGEEFAVLLEESDANSSRRIAERIRKKIEALTFWQAGEKVVPTMSLGLAVYPDDGIRKSLLISRADQALYHSKRAGRNRTTVWSALPTEARRQLLAKGA